MIRDRLTSPPPRPTPNSEDNEDTSPYEEGRGLGVGAAHQAASRSRSGRFASNTAIENPSGVSLRRSARSSLGGIRQIFEPRTGTTRLGVGMTKPLPVQRQ